MDEVFFNSLRLAIWFPPCISLLYTCHVKPSTHAAAFSHQVPPLNPLSQIVQVVGPVNFVCIKDDDESFNICQGKNVEN